MYVGMDSDLEAVGSARGYGVCKLAKTKRFCSSSLPNHFCWREQERDTWDQF